MADPVQNPTGPNPDTLAMLQQVMAARSPMQPGAPPSPMIGTLPGMGQPTTPPAAAPGPMGPTSPFDMSENIQKVMQIPQVQAMLSNLGNIQSQMGTEQMRSRALATPQGQMVPGTGQGGAPGLAGEMPKMQFSPDMHGSLLHKIGQALLAVGAQTQIGRGIENQVYGPARQQWGAQRESNVQALSDLKAQLGVPTEELKSVSGLGQGAGMLAYRGGVLADKEQRTAIAKTNSQTQAMRAANEQANALVRQAQGWERLTVDQQRANADSAFKSAIVPIMQARIDAGMDENDARVQAQEDIRAAAANNAYIQSHPVLSAVFGVPGGLSQTPGAQTPVPQSQGRAKKPAKATPKKSVGDTVNF